MDFSRIELDAEHRQLRDDVQAFVAEHVTPDVLAQEAATGDGFDEGVHLAMGRRGWLLPRRPRDEGGAGLDRLGAYILERELAVARTPSVTLSTTRLVVPAIERHAHPAIRDEVLAGIARGTVRVCLGYTEPHGGSDVADARTRAVRDGGDWIVNGAKMFTTGAHNCQYSFLIARTDPDRPKHKGLSMFLLPLERPGVEIQAVRAFSGERTNMVFYDDVRVGAEYLLGEVNAGWAVLRSSLDAEHGVAAGAGDGLDQLSMGSSFLHELHAAYTEVLDWADTPRADGSRPADDPVVVQRLGRIAVESAAGLVTPDAAGRVQGAETTVWAAAELLDLLGPAGLVPAGQQGAVGHGRSEHLHRFAQGSITYGGSVEVFRTLIAQHELGLPRPRYRPVSAPSDPA